jgi:protoheme IX farnesyltransferase
VRKNNITGLFLVYADLIKYKLSAAVTFSSVTGYFIFHNAVNINLLYLISGVFLLASGSAALNQYSEIRWDALMTRTKQRPLPGEKIHPSSALLVSVGLLCSGLMLLFLTGIIAPLLGAVNVFLYNFVYTKLKRITLMAIIPGALVGAIPPLIGYEAAGGYILSGGIVLFSTFMFLWQLPHFWLIMLKYRRDYKNAGFVTLSDYANEKQIRILVFGWTTFSTLLLFFFSLRGVVLNRHLSTALIPLNIIFISAFHYMLFRNTDKNKIRFAFVMINSFSLAIMILFIINSFL